MGTSHSQGSANLPSGQGGNNQDDGEYFEINIAGIIRFRCKRFTAKAIAALIIVLLFAWIMIKK